MRTPQIIVGPAWARGLWHFTALYLRWALAGAAGCVVAASARRLYIDSAHTFPNENERTAVTLVLLILLFLLFTAFVQRTTIFRGDGGIWIEADRSSLPTSFFGSTGQLVSGESRIGVMLLVQNGELKHKTFDGTEVTYPAKVSFRFGSRLSSGDTVPSDSAVLQIHSDFVLAEFIITSDAAKEWRTFLTLVSQSSETVS